jgi:hypothetical protein
MYLQEVTAINTIKDEHLKSFTSFIKNRLVSTYGV